MPKKDVVVLGGLEDLLRGVSLEVQDASQLDFLTAQRIVDCHDGLGECVMYDDQTNCILWTDILGNRCHKLQLPSWSSSKTSTKSTTTSANEGDSTTTNNNKIVMTTYSDLPKKLCSFGLLDMTTATEPTETAATAEGEEKDVEKETQVASKKLKTEKAIPSEASASSNEESLPLLCAWEDGFQLYDLGTQTALSEPSRGPTVNPAKGPTRLNDGRVDRSGHHYICGGYYGEDPEVKMDVYTVSLLVQVQKKTDGDEEQQQQQQQYQLVHEPILTQEVQVTNSICWSLDGTKLYLADSPSSNIYQFDYHTNEESATAAEASAILSNKSILHTKKESDAGFPDGSCVDSEGYLWNAVWRKETGLPGMVQRIDPKTGQVVFTVHLPDATSQASCCCFGSETLDILFITTAAEHKPNDKEPHAGALYAVKVPFKGLPESRFKVKQ